LTQDDRLPALSGGLDRPADQFTPAPSASAHWEFYGWGLPATASGRRALRLDRIWAARIGALFFAHRASTFRER
jgi:hypothetical protein